MKFAVLKESTPLEARVAIVPDTAKQLIQKNHQVFIESGAGVSSYITDEMYSGVGCKILNQKNDLIQNADCILKVRAPSDSEINAMKPDQAIIAFLWALRSPELVLTLKNKKITSFSMDSIPRISRAQSMDALSSMATIAGYKAALIAADHLGKFMPMLTTAAGTIRPAQGFIIGAGVAGLQAIATARRLGSVVEAFDTRPAVKEQVLSLGARFAEFKMDSHETAEDKGGYAKEHSKEFLQKEAEFLAAKIKASDFVITTAQIPGKKAPVLITKNMVENMQPGSVIIDLAAETGGNCELTKPDQTYRHNGVAIIGPTNLPSLMPLDASRMYSRNMFNLIMQITNQTGFTNDFSDEVFAETCITMNGEIKHPKLRN